MLHLHYLVCLKDILYLAMLQTKIQSNNKFRYKLFLFLEYIINYLANENHHLQILDQACLNANDSITISQFANLFRSDSEAVMQKVQIHSPFYNPTCYKYITYKSKVYKFDFPRLLLPNSEIDINGILWPQQDNI